MKKIKNKISLIEASELLKKPSTLLSRKRVIEHMEVVYLPYYFFNVEITFSNNTKITKSVCIDAIDGDYAFIDDESFLNSTEEYTESDSEITIDSDKASEIARKTVKDIVLMRMKKGINVDTLRCNMIQIIKYPYWIGLYRKNQKIEFDALDAITGQKQGAKMRPVLLKLIMQ